MALWADDYRWAQVQESWADVVAHCAPDDLPVFGEYLPEMIKECGGEAAVMEQAGGEDIATVMWKKLASGWKPKGYKTNLNRFFASREKAESFLPWWHATLAKYEHLGLETGQLATRRIARLKLRSAPVPKGTEMPAETTDSSRPTIAERALRSSAQNAMVLATVMLGDRWHQLLVRVVVRSSAPLHKWHRHQNHTLRSAADSAQWAVAQLQGSYQAAVAETLGELQSVASLEFVGFGMRLGLGGFDEGVQLDPLSFQEGGMEQDLAEVFGSLCCTLAARRVVRTAFFTRGWPLRFVGLLGPADMRRHILAEFRRDWEAWQALRDFPEKDVAMQGLLDRSSFNDTATNNLCWHLLCACRSVLSWPSLSFALCVCVLGGRLRCWGN